MFSWTSWSHGIDDVRNYLPYCSFKAGVAFAGLAKIQNIINLGVVFDSYYNLKEDIITHKKLDDSNSKNSVNMPNYSEKESEKLPYYPT